ELAHERRVIVPGARRHQVARHHHRLIDVGRPAAFRVELALRHGRHRPAAQHARRRDDLDAVTDAGHGQVAVEERPYDAHQVRVVAQVLGGTAAGDDEAVVLLGLDVLEGDVSRKVVAWALAGDVPAFGPLVKHQGVGALRRAGDDDLVAGLLHAEERVERVEHLGGVADDEQYFGHDDVAPPRAGIAWERGQYTETKAWSERHSNPSKVIPP